MRGPCRREKLERTSPLGEEGAAQRVLLLVLLLVAVLFGYLYFFTGMIKAREEAVPPPVVASVTKKPLPPRPGAEEPAGAGEEKTKPAAGAVSESAGNVSATTDGGKIVPAKPAVAPPKKEQPIASKPVPAAQPLKANPPAKAVQQKKDQQQTTPLPAASPKKAGDAESIPSKKIAPAKKVGAQYALFAGEFILAENLKNTQRQLKKAGIQTFTVSTRTKLEPMHRVRLGEFPSRAEAETELQKLQKAAGAAFILPADGKYAVYAGSYFNAGQASREKDRLNALVPGGMSVTVEKAEVNVPVKRLIAGAFPDKETATAEAARLKKRGMTTSVVPLRKAGR